MSLLPVGLSRISEPLKNQRLLGQLNTDQLAIQRLSDQLSTGKRINRISDDPAAAGRAFILQRGINRTEQFSRNAGVTASFYNATDSSLARMSDALIDSRGATVEAAQNTLSPEERGAHALTIQRAIESAVASGNAIFRDHQLLGGILQNQEALRFDGNDVVFSGTDAVAKTNVGGGDLIPTGVTGNDALGLSKVIFDGAPLGASIDRTTRLSDLRKGEGVNPGILRISDSGNFVSVDLRKASTVGDLVDVVGAIKLDGRQLQVTLQPDGITVGFADGLPGTLAIDDAAGDSLAKDLSIINPTGLRPPPLVANGLTPRVTGATPLSRLAGGGGIDVGAGIQIKSGSRTTIVDLSDARNVGDVLIAINRSGADVKAELNEQTGGISIRALRSGINYSVGENGGSAAQALGIRTASGNTKLADLDNQRGIALDPLGAEFSITRPDGTLMEFNLEGVKTVEDVLDLIRDHPLNQDAQRVIPSMNPRGNGIQLLAPPGPNPITVWRGEISNAAELLGFVKPGQNSSNGVTLGPFAVFNSNEFNTLEAGGTIDTLIRLQQAVRGGDVREIGRLQGLLDIGIDKMNNIRGRVGVWSQNVDQMKDAAEGQKIALTAELSTEVDTDFAAVVSEMTQRQASLEASMRLIGQTARLSLIDFL